MAGGAGAVGDFAKTDVAGQGAQQRGFANIGVADYGEFQRWVRGFNHGQSPAS